ncbi:helix-turn-helix domain-containing protein [Nonomuraea rubra]
MAADGLRRGENAVVLALAQGKTTDQAAQAGGVSGRTVRRWLADDHAFAARVKELRGELLDRAVGALVDASLEAIATLRCSLHAESESVRVRAATAILNAMVSIRESVDLEERLAALEAAERESQHG